MDLVFICPCTQKAFKSSNYDLVNNKGIKCDNSGNKFLDAEVMLTDPCPFCGIRHIYHANELSCPFNG